MLRVLVAAVALAALGGCVSTSPIVVETPPDRVRLSFDGTLDLIHPGSASN